MTGICAVGQYVTTFQDFGHTHLSGGVSPLLSGEKSIVFSDLAADLAARLFKALSLGADYYK